MIDARRDYSYAAIYDKEKEILSPCHIKNMELKDKLKKIEPYCIISNDDIKIEGTKENYEPDILKIVERYRSRENINPHIVNPSYLKLTEAEESKM